MNEKQQTREQEHEFFLIEQKSFLSLLNAMQPICTKRTTIEATSCLYFHVEPHELIIKSTDLEISLQASYPLKDSLVKRTHSFLVSGKKLFDLMKELQEAVMCTFSGSQLLLHSESVHLSLHSKDAQEFPPFPEKIENLMTFKATDLLQMLSKVIFLIPQNNPNSSLNGLLLEVNDRQCTMTTTDGHCLAQVSHADYQLPGSQKWLLPRRAVFELKKILEGCLENEQIFLGICKNQIVFSGSTFNFFSKLLHDNFPSYEAIMDKAHFVPARVDRSQFLKTLRRSSCLLSGQFVATKFEFNKKNIKVSMHNHEVGSLSEEINLVDFDGPEVNMRFYAPYLLSGLQVLCDDTIHIFLNNPSKPLIFESANNNIAFTYLVMPVAPNNG